MYGLISGWRRREVQENLVSGALPVFFVQNTECVKGPSFQVLCSEPQQFSKANLTRLRVLH
jgi:hypothetical protein